MKNIDKFLRFILAIVIVGVLIGLSYFKNTDAVNLFSVTAAVVSIILAVYSLFTSENNNEQANKTFKDLEVLSTKIDTKLDFINDNVKQIATISRIDDSGNKEEDKVVKLNNAATVYIEHLWCESEMKINTDILKVEIEKILSKYKYNCNVLSADILQSTKSNNIVTMFIILDGEIDNDKLSEIANSIKDNSNMINCTSKNYKSMIDVVTLK